MLKNEMEYYGRIGGFEKSYIRLHGGRGGQKLPKIMLT